MTTGLFVMSMYPSGAYYFQQSNYFNLGFECNLKVINCLTIGKTEGAAEVILYPPCIPCALCG